MNHKFTQRDYCHLTMNHHFLTVEENGVVQKCCSEVLEWQALYGLSQFHHRSLLS